MPYIILPRRWNQQPQGPVEIDESNPLCAGVRSIITPTLQKSLGVAQVDVKQAGPGSVIATAQGQALWTPAGSQGVQFAAAHDIVPQGTQVTIAIYRRCADTTARNTALFGMSSSQQVLIHAPWSDGNAYFDWGGNGGNARISAAFTKTTTPETLVFQYSVPVSYKAIWRNGALMASSTTVATITGVDNLPVALGSRYSDLGGDNTEIYLFMATSKLWSPAEIQAFNENPWQIFKPQRYVSYFNVGGGSGQALAGAATANTDAVGSLTHDVPVAGAGLSVATASGGLSVAIPLAGSASGAAAATGDLSVTGNAGLAGNASATANASGELTIVIPLSGTAVAQALVSAGITNVVPLAGVAGATAAASGSLSISVSLSGAAISQAAASAGLSIVGSSSLAGNAAAASAASASLTHAVPLSGAAVTIATGAGALTHIVPVAGAAASASLATGGLDVSVQLGAAALAQALAAAALSAEGGLAATAAAEAASTGTLTLRINLDAAALVQAMAAGALTSDGLLTAATPGWTVSRPARTWTVSRPARTWRISA